ncbi:alpha/beta hydrolase, partial [Vibrio anguillarum]|nr:alpha/beta hydrolase [Vibrio anguillarum]
MIEFIKKQDNNSLILFIHGFTGGDDTWSYSKVCSFPQLLADDLDISSSYDIATFSYYTKLSSTYSKTLNIGKFISNLFRTSHKKLKSNSSIEEISNLLRTEIRFNLASYDNIVVVAHSMGGLVTKSAIVKDIEDNSVSKIK